MRIMVIMQRRETDNAQYNIIRINPDNMNIELEEQAARSLCRALQRAFRSIDSEAQYLEHDEVTCMAEYEVP